MFRHQFYTQVPHSNVSEERRKGQGKEIPHDAHQINVPQSQNMTQTLHDINKLSRSHTDIYKIRIQGKVTRV
jgi:hypothetical protein